MRIPEKNRKQARWIAAAVFVAIYIPFVKELSRKIDQVLQRKALFVLYPVPDAGDFRRVVTVSSGAFSAKRAYRHRISEGG